MVYRLFNLISKFTLPKKRERKCGFIVDFLCHYYADSLCLKARLRFYNMRSSKLYHMHVRLNYTFRVPQI